MFTPYPFQLKDVSFMRDNKNVLNANEMGLGKTIECIMMLNMAKKVDNVLIVCPASLKYNWLVELKEKLTRKLSIYVVNGKNFSKKNITIINYDILNTNREEVLKDKWSMVIFDEAHYLKNPKAKRTQIGRKIRAHRKILLTGTPINNRPIELWVLLDYLQPGAWGTYHKFGYKYCDPTHTHWGLKFDGATNKADLNMRLKKVMVRNLKKDVLSELPDKVYQIIELMPDKHTELSLANECQAVRHANPEIGDFTTLNETGFNLMLSNLKSNAFKDKDEHIATIRRENGVNKAPYIIDHLKNASDKVVCFCHHKAVISKLAEEFKDDCVVITGETPSKRRQERVEAFQNNPKIKYFIGNIKAAGVGLTLTAASHVVFGEMDFVPAVMMQAADRLHRIGQKNSVLIQYLVMKDSLDAIIARMLVKKQVIIKEIVDDDLSFLE